MCKNFIAFVILFIGIVNVCLADPDWREEAYIQQQIFDAQLLLSDSSEVNLHSYVKEKPLLLALIFTRCSGVCYPFLLQLKETLKGHKKYGSFNVLALSFDPWDSLPQMQKMADFFDLGSDTNWNFAVTNDIDLLNKSVGFYPVWSETLRQFDHDAFLVGVNTQGNITKKLIGIRDRKDIDLMLMSIDNKFIPTYKLPSSNSIFSCFNYNPETGKLEPGLGLLFILLPAVFAFLLVIGIRLSVRER